MSLAFYYLVGQNATYLSASLAGSMVTTTAVLLLTAVITVFDWRALLAVALGWLSVAYVPEHRLGTSTRTFTCHENTEHHHQSILFITELVIFWCFTSAVNIDDSAFWIWLIMIVCHVFYVMVSELINRFSERVVIPSKVETVRKYYLIYLVIICFSDSFFAAITLIAYNRSQNIASIGILAGITFIVVYIADNLDFVQKFDFIFIQQSSSPSPLTSQAPSRSDAISV